MPESKGENPLVNAQQLSDEQVCNTFNKFLVGVEAKLFRRNNRVRFLEEELENKKEELTEKSKELKQKDMINA
ncbi:hypothetical protein KI387_024043, partial [Taxus chinensis]